MDVVAAQDDVNAPVGGNDRGHSVPRPPRRAPTPQGTFRVHAPILSHAGSTGCEQNRGRGHATSSGQVSRRRDVKRRSLPSMGSVKDNSRASSRSGVVKSSMSTSEITG